MGRVAGALSDVSAVGSRAYGGMPSSPIPQGGTGLVAAPQMGIVGPGKGFWSSMLDALAAGGAERPGPGGVPRSMVEAPAPPPDQFTGLGVLGQGQWQRDERGGVEFQSADASMGAMSPQEFAAERQMNAKPTPGLVKDTGTGLRRAVGDTLAVAPQAMRAVHVAGQYLGEGLQHVPGLEQTGAEILQENRSAADRMEAGAQAIQGPAPERWTGKVSHFGGTIAKMTLAPAAGMTEFAVGSADDMYNRTNSPLAAIGAGILAYASGHVGAQSADVVGQMAARRVLAPVSEQFAGTALQNANQAVGRAAMEGNWPLVQAIITDLSGGAAQGVPMTLIPKFGNALIEEAANGGSMGPRLLEELKSTLEDLAVGMAGGAIGRLGGRFASGEYQIGREPVAPPPPPLVTEDDFKIPVRNRAGEEPPDAAQPAALPEAPPGGPGGGAGQQVGAPDALAGRVAQRRKVVLGEEAGRAERPAGGGVEAGPTPAPPVVRSSVGAGDQAEVGDIRQAESGADLADGATIPSLAQEDRPAAVVGAPADDAAAVVAPEPAPEVAGTGRELDVNQETVRHGEPSGGEPTKNFDRMSAVELKNEAQAAGIDTRTGRAEMIRQLKVRQESTNADRSASAQERPLASRQDVAAPSRPLDAGVEAVVRDEGPSAGNQPGDVDGVKAPVVATRKTGEPHKFSSTQFDLPPNVANAVRMHSLGIREGDLAENGRETTAHVTVKYGLHGDDPEAVRRALADQPPIRARLGKTSIFSSDEHDVVKIDVHSADLHALNRRIADALPHTDTHPEYRPHVTLAYTKPGAGKKYVGSSPLEGKTITLDHLTFSDRAGNQTVIKLTGPRGQETPNAEPPQPVQPVPARGQQEAAGQEGAAAPPGQEEGQAATAAPAPARQPGERVRPGGSAEPVGQPGRSDVLKRPGASSPPSAERGNALNAQGGGTPPERPATASRKGRTGSPATRTTGSPLGERASNTPEQVVDKRIKKFREAAVSQRSQAEKRRGSSYVSEARTARQARIGNSISEEADRMERFACLLDNFAKAVEQGNLPKALAGVQSTAQLREIYNRARHRQQYENKGSRVNLPERMPLPLVSATEVRQALEAVKGKRGSVELANKLGMYRHPPSDGGWANTVFSERDRDLLDKLEKMAHEAGATRIDLSQSRNIYETFAAAGVTEGNVEDAFRGVLALAGGRASGENPVTKLERDLVGQKGVGIDFFPTPTALAKEVVRAADIKPGMSVLEPSAGNGHLADAAKAAGGEVSTLEVSSQLSKILDAKGHRVIGSDFMAMPAYPGYDRVVMNPPFSGGADIEHVRHAFEMLKAGGKLVAIMSEGPFFRSDQQAKGFRDWLDSVGGESEKLPEGSFAKGENGLPSTGVNARLVEIERGGGIDAGGMRGETSPSASGHVRAYEALSPEAKDYLVGRLKEGRGGVFRATGDKAEKELVSSGLLARSATEDEGFGTGDVFVYKDIAATINSHLAGSSRGGPGARPGFSLTPSQIATQVVQAARAGAKALASMAGTAKDVLAHPLRAAIRTLAQHELPRTSAISERAADALVRAAVADKAGLYAAADLEARVMGRPALYHDERFRRLLGAVLSEGRLRAMEARFRDNDKNGVPFPPERDPAQPQSWADKAAAVGTFIGKPNSPLKTQADYQTALQDPDIVASAANHVAFVMPYINERFKALKNDPTADFPEVDPITGAFISLMALDPATGEPIFESGHATRPGKPLQTIKRGPKNAVQASGSGQLYETDYGKILRWMVASRDFSEIAKQDAYRVLEREGVAVIAQQGKQFQTPAGPSLVPEINGKPAHRDPIVIQRKGVPRFDQEGDVAGARTYQQHLWLDPRVFHEASRAIDPRNEEAPWVQWVNKVLNATQVYGLVDAAAHLGNMSAQVVRNVEPTISAFRRPGLAAARTTQALRPVEALTRIAGAVRRIMRDDPEVRKQLAEMASMTDLRSDTSKFNPINPLGWPNFLTSRLIHTMHRAGALVLDDLYREGVGAGKLDAPWYRRRFLNQLGQYNARLMGPMQRAMRWLGAAPFTVAGVTFNRTGIMGVLGLSQSKSRSFGRAVAAWLARLFATTLVTALMAAAWNFWQTGDVMGRPGVPFMAMDLGGKDQQGRARYFDPFQITGSRRGFRILGGKAIAEGMRYGKSKSDIVDDAARDVATGMLHPWFGPPLDFASTALTGRDVLQGGRRVAPVARPDQSQAFQNLMTALRHLNPSVEQTTGDAPSGVVDAITQPFERAAGFGAGSPPKVEARHFAELRDYIDDLDHRARTIPRKDRRQFILTESRGMTARERGKVLEELFDRRDVMAGK